MPESTQVPNDLRLQLDDSRRLTGKNLLSDMPGAIIDAFVDGADKQQVVDCWQRHARGLLDELGWQKEDTFSRVFEDGVTLAISAPLDALYSACEVNEAAWQLAVAELSSTPAPESLAEALGRLRTAIDDEANPALVTLIKHAQQHDAPWLTDDDEFSLGYGHSARVWPVGALPDVNSLPWQELLTVPLALVTGTNGKSTSVRLSAHIVAQSGRCCGVTSTDFIRVGDQVLDRGDYSGPGGARRLLRHPKTQTAILEIARGGILRRGLPVDHADAALITNIAEDHLHQYGINTVEALASAKAVVARALDESGVLVLNAEDPYLSALGPSLPGRHCWFAMEEGNPLMARHRTGGGAVCFVRDGQLLFCEHNQEVALAAIDDVPMTLKGAAKHNVLNALGAIGLTKALGIDDAAITRGLTTFSSNQQDNPGRGNVFEFHGAQVIIDFAHNVHSMKAIAHTVASMPGQRTFVMISHAGDRSDREIRELTEAALGMSPDVLVIAEIADYLRGRELGEVPQLIAEVAQAEGITSEQRVLVESPTEGAKQIIAQLQAGDLALMMVLAERDQVLSLFA